MIRWLGRGVSTRVAEDRLTAMTDGSFEVVLVEVYDHPDAKVATHGDAKGQLTGPWLLGPEDEVRAELTARGFEEFEIKSSAGGGGA